MTDQTDTKNIKVVTYRPEGQKREYSTFVEISSNPLEISLRFGDLKPPTTPEELEEIQKEGKVNIPINTEIVMPFIVAEALASILRQQLDNIKEQAKQAKTEKEDK
jgi:hypothetical protein